jgi:amino acid transporter
MATLTAQSAELTALLRNDKKKNSLGTEVGINFLFIGLTAISHCLGVKLYGKIERVIMWFKLLLFVLVCVFMVIINVGGGGPRTGPYDGNYTSNAFTPGFKPTGFDSTSTPFLRNAGVDDTHFGMTGAGGRLFAFLTALAFCMFSCMGGEMVAMTAGEAKRPYKDIPIVMSFVYVVPLSLYPLMMLSAGANVNYADPDLPKLWSAGIGNLPRSPFVIAVEHSSLHGLPVALNLFFVISGYTAANTALYVASRTVFVLAQQYLPRRYADVLGRTNNGHTPLAAIGLCSILGLLSLVGLSQYAYSQPRITLSELYTGTLACVYICECFTFLKFKAGLERLGKHRILSRDDPLYIERLFRSRWQPLPTYVGIVGCSFLILWSGITPLYILAARGSLTSTTNLKSAAALAFDVIGAYIGPIFFATFYLVYKYITPRSFSVDIRDLTPSHYVLEDIDPSDQKNPEDAERNASTATDHDHRNDSHAFELESPTENRFSVGTAARGKAPVDVYGQYDEHMSPDMQDEIEAKRARDAERQRIKDILLNRPKMLERGFWREAWSLVW